ncbi:MAG: cytochrome c peroxidase [Bacteroidia bacterium]
MPIPKISLISVGLIFVFSSCQKDEPLPSLPKQVMMAPGHFPSTVYNFGNFPPDEKKVAIGRRLFYDESLSLDSTISCASCHKQNAAFADEGRQVSTGVNGSPGFRNAPALFNLAWKPLFMWDGGIVNLELQPIAPITDAHEMSMSLSEVLIRLNSNENYKQLYKGAFGTEEINSQMLLVSFAQFLATMVSSQSAYDKFILGDATSLNENQVRGLNIFRENCSSCHTEPLLSDYSFRRNGLSITAQDSGRQRITLDEDDRGRFMVPSVRNISLSSPYMHDGRFQTLDEVIDHYINPENTFQIDESIGIGIPLNNEERGDLIEFLKSLDDPHFVNNPIFSDPVN